MLPRGGLLVATRNCAAPRFPAITLSSYSETEFSSSQDIGFETDPDLYNVFSKLNNYTTMIDNFCEGRQIVAASVLIDHRNMTQHALLSLPPRTGRSECYRLAAMIYSLLVTFPLPYMVAPFAYLITQLKLTLSEWDGDDDHMLLWVLTMGGIGATGLGERMWFMQKLQDVAARIGIRSWFELRDAIKRGLWHETTNDRDGQGLWLESRITE
jgi:Fungal specific transcription factor domain